MNLRVGQRVLANSKYFVSSPEQDVPEYFEMVYKGKDMNDTKELYKHRHHFIGVGPAYKDVQLWTPNMDVTFNEGYLKLKNDFVPTKIPTIRHKFI